MNADGMASREAVTRALIESIDDLMSERLCRCGCGGLPVTDHYLKVEAPIRMLIIDLYDESRDQWRQFMADHTFKAQCDNGLHQFPVDAKTCVCTKILARKVAR